MSELSPTALLVDDESALREHLRQLLTELWPELKVINEAGDGEKALVMIRTLRPDIIFLDIRMPVLNGVEVARELATYNLNCHIVFVTAFDDHALEAFEQSAVDYILKPVTTQRLKKCVSRLRNRLGKPQQDLALILSKLETTMAPQYRQWIKVMHGEEVYLLAVSEVDFFKAADKYTSIYANGKEWIIRVSLKTLENELDPNLFWRIHRSILVRVASISHASRDLVGHWSVEIAGYKYTLPVSRNHAYKFKMD